MLLAVREGVCCFHHGRRRNVSPGNVRAAGLFCIRIAGECVGAGPRAAADLLELAGAAFAFQLDPCRANCGRAATRDRWRSSGWRRMLPALKAAEIRWERLRRLGDEDEPFAVVQSARRAADQCRRILSGVALADSRPALSRMLLQQVAAVVLRLGGLDVEGRGPRELVKIFAKTCSNSSAFSRSLSLPRPVGTRKKTLHSVICRLSISATMSSISPMLRRLKVVLICTGKPTSLAQRTASRVRANDPLMPRNASCVCGAGAVHADGQPRQAGFLEPDDNLPRQQRRGARRERDAHAHRPGVADQLEQIGPLDGVAAGEHEDGHLHRRNLIDQVACLRPCSVPSGWRSGCADARQCTQARSQAWVTSQMARKGRSLKSIV